MWSSTNGCQSKCTLSNQEKSVDQTTNNQISNNTDHETEIAFSAGLLVGAGYKVEKYDGFFNDNFTPDQLKNRKFTYILNNYNEAITVTVSNGDFQETNSNKITIQPHKWALVNRLSYAGLGKVTFQYKQNGKYKQVSENFSSPRMYPYILFDPSGSQYNGLESFFECYGRKIVDMSFQRSNNNIIHWSPSTVRICQ